MLTDVLYEIQQSNFPSVPSEGNIAPETIIIPTSQKLYEVNLSNRTIHGPDTLSVQSDHYAETVYFIMDRFYDHMDLAQTNCVIQYVSNGNSYVYAVPFCDITTYEGKMIIPWSISASATEISGNIKYFIKFYILDNSSNFTYSLNTLPATSRVLSTLSGEDFSAEDKELELPERFFEIVDIFAQMVDNSTVYWNEV